MAERRKRGLFRRSRAEIFIDSEVEETATPEERRKRKKMLEFKYWGSVVLVWAVGIIFLAVTCSYLFTDREGEKEYWETYSAPTDESLAEEAQAIAKRSDAAQVTCGTYLENLESIAIKEGYYTAVWLVWFEWQDHDDLDFTENFRIYKGAIDSLEVVQDYSDDKGVHYQRFRIHTTISKTFWTPRFPLESHQLRMYIEPDYSVEEVNLVQSTYDDKANPNMSVSGYNIINMDAGIEYIAYENDFDDPTIGEEDAVIKAEHMNQIEINRDGFGLYFKCFIALWATIIWVLIMLFAATRHKVDAFEYIPETLFGAAANILVGAELLPESLQIGLLEFGNMWGIFIIFAATVTIMTINRERTYWQNENFAERYGRTMLASIAALAIIGNLALPLCSFIF